MNLSFLLRFWLAAASDPWRRVAPNIARIVQADRDQVALKEPAQIIAAAIEAELHTTPIDGRLHFRWATEGQRDVSATGGFFGSHLAELLSDFVQRHWSLLNQDRTNIAKIDVSGTVALKDHKVAGIRREIDPFRARYPDQGATAGFNQKRPERAKSDLFVNLLNHTQLEYDRIVT
jgi:hypothetical protein